MQQIQENLFVILSLLIFGSAAFILFKRFGKPDQSQNQIINSDEVFSELSKSKEEAAKFTALAQERKFEVEQLKVSCQIFEKELMNKTYSCANIPTQ